MIVVKAPLRISYIGGGSDFPSFFETQPGCVVGATIDKYVYVYASPLSSIADEHIRFTYRETESVGRAEELKHPVLREMLRLMDYGKATNFGTFADLPSGVGLGGSSSFTVALAKTLGILKGVELSVDSQAEIAIEVERKLLAESGGYQDQYHAAIRGLRSYIFSKDGVSYSKELLNKDQIKFVEERQMLVWTGSQRNSTTHADFTSKKMETGDFSKLATWASECARYLSDSSTGQEAYETIYYFVQKGWQMKQEFMTNLEPGISKLIDRILDLGANSLKLCGAGGSGFLLVLAEPRVLSKIEESIGTNRVIHFKFDSIGRDNVIEF